jgi:protein TonB
MRGDAVVPRLLRRAEVRNPKGREGLVIVELIVGTDGRVDEPCIVRSLGAELDDEAVRAVRSWLFSPGTLSGKPVRVLLTVSVPFKRPKADRR